MARLNEKGFEMFAEIYVAERLRCLREGDCEPASRLRGELPGSNVRRTGVGVVHEVFRRIAGEGPAPRPLLRRVAARLT